MSKSFAPAGFVSVTPYLIVLDAKALIAFMKTVFDAETLMEPVLTPDGKVMHAQMKIGDSMVMLSDNCDGGKAIPAMLHVYVENPDETFARGLKAGAKESQPVKDQFYGDRAGSFVDPTGNTWWVSTPIKKAAVA